MSLVCYRKCLADLLNHDGLLVMAKGLRQLTVMCKLLKVFCGTGKLLLVLNAEGSERVIVDTLRADGVPPQQLPYVIDYDTGAADRKARYLGGGVFIVTARILVPDLLAGRVPSVGVAGMVVCNAHLVNETSSLTYFALRLWRDKGGTGFVKALSDEPEALTAGFGRLEKTLRALFVTRVFVWPRFHVLVARELDTRRYEVKEYNQPLTPAMQAIQRCILECLDACLAELKRTTTVDVDLLTLENGLFERFDDLVRRQLESTWDTVRQRTKRVIEDMRVLRKLLQYLLRYDAVSFHTFLDMLRIASAPTPGIAARQAPENEWIRSEAGISLWRASLSRLYRCEEIEPGASREHYGAVASVDDAALLESLTNGPTEVVELAGGSQFAASAAAVAPGTCHRRFALRRVLEHSPKWHLLGTVMREISDGLHDSSVATNSADHGAGAAKTVAAVTSCGAVAAPQLPLPQCLPIDGAAVLVVVRDERTCAHVRELLTTGPDAMMDASFAALLRKLAARSRRMRAAVLSSMHLAQFPSPQDAARLARLQQLLPQDEYELILASEVPGWPPASASAAAPSGHRVEQAMPTAPEPLDATNGCIDDQEQHLLLQALVDLHGMPSVASELDGAHAETEEAATTKVVLGPSTLEVTAADTAAGKIGSDTVSASRLLPARVLAKVAGGGATGARPFVLPEQRLLWRACAQAMLRERQEVLQVHAALLAQVMRCSVEEERLRPIAAVAPAASNSAPFVAGDRTECSELLEVGTEDGWRTDGTFVDLFQSQLAEACQLSLEDLRESQAQLATRMSNGSSIALAAAAVETWSQEEELGGEHHDAATGTAAQSSQVADSGTRLPTAGSIEGGAPPALPPELASSRDQAQAVRDCPRATCGSSLQLMDPTMRDMLTEALGRRHAHSAADIIAGSAYAGSAAASGRKRSAGIALLSSSSNGAAPEASTHGGSKPKHRRLQQAIDGEAPNIAADAAPPAPVSSSSGDADFVEAVIVCDDEEEVEKGGGLGAGCRRLDAPALPSKHAHPTAHLDTIDQALALRRRQQSGRASSSSSSSAARSSSSSLAGMLGIGSQRRSALLSAYRRNAPSARIASAAVAAGARPSSAATSSSGQFPATSCSDSGNRPAVRASVLPRGSQVVVYPLSRLDGSRLPLLPDVRPSAVVLYDPDPAFMREVEVYAASAAAGGPPLRVYVCYYEASAEKQRFLSTVRQEQAAFERIISEKATMAPPPLTIAAAAQGGSGVLDPVMPARKSVPDGWGILHEGEHLQRQQTAGAAAAAAARRPLTVDIGCVDRGRRVICVDLREFRAKLPMALYKAGLELAQGTLTVGDFILTPDMCVERKSVPDLLQSFSSGRLYTQAVAMARYYRWPVLCVEFEESRPFSLQPFPDSIKPHEIDPGNPVSKLVLLTMHVPSLRILWSRSAAASATLFAALKQSEPEPDLEAAMRVGAEAEGAADPEAPATGAALIVTAPTNIAGMELLRKLPGVNGGNCMRLAARAGSLARLAAMSEEELAPILGAGGARSLVSFLRARNAASLSG